MSRRVVNGQRSIHPPLLPLFGFSSTSSGLDHLTSLSFCLWLSRCLQVSPSDMLSLPSASLRGIPTHKVMLFWLNSGTKPSWLCLGNDWRFLFSNWMKKKKKKNRTTLTSTLPSRHRHRHPLKSSETDADGFLLKALSELAGRCLTCCVHSDPQLCSWLNPNFLQRQKPNSYYPILRLIFPSSTNWGFGAAVTQ